MKYSEIGQKVSFLPDEALLGGNNQSLRSVSLRSTCYFESYCMNRALLTFLAAELSVGRPVVMLTVVEARGSTPRKAGSRMLLLRDGRSHGSIGGGNAERQALILARRAFETKASGLHHFTMTDSVAAAEGMACGGAMRVFIHYIEAEADKHESRRTDRNMG